MSRVSRLRCAAPCALAVAVVACRRGEPQPAPAPEGPPPAVLHLRVTDGPGGPPIAARVYLWGGPAGDHPIHIGVRDLYDGKRQVMGYCMLGTGALGTWDGLVLPWGTADVPIGGGDGCTPSPAIPLGTYRVWAWRGIEYERWEGRVTIGAGDQVDLTIPLTRAFDPRGAVAADMHVHAAGSNDSGLPDAIRVMTEAAAGIQVMGLSNHEDCADAGGTIRALGLGGTIASIPSDEFGNDWVHLGIYPVVVDRRAPRGGSPSFDDVKDLDGAQMLFRARAFPGRPIVQVNHPRFRTYALFDTTQWDGLSWPPPFPLDFDAVEVLNGHTAFDAPGDMRLGDSVRDFITFITHGYLVAAVGNSDTHHLDGVRAGVARTYVYLDDRRLAPLDVRGFVRAIRGRRAVATTCPWLEVRAGVPGPGAVPAGPGEATRAPGGMVGLDVELDQARWCHADRIRIWLGGVVIRTIPVPADQRTTRAHLAVPVGSHDTWIAVDAIGSDPLPAVITGTYQQEKGRRGVAPYAIANPILLDVDGDGRVRYGIADVPVPTRVVPRRTDVTP